MTSSVRGCLTNEVGLNLPLTIFEVETENY